MLADYGVRGAAQLWYAKTLAAGGAVPYARDEPRSHAGEGPADRVLLIGNGPAHGWGVVSHQLALCGQLAAVVSKATGRAVDVEYVGAELMNAASALAWLGDRDLAGYDAVVVVMGLSDAVRLTPVKAWERNLEALIAHLRGGLRHEAPIVVAGVPPVAAVPPYRGLVAVLGQRRADAMNAATRRIVSAAANCAFVPLGAPELEPSRPYGSRVTYQAWADALSASAAPLLDAHHARGSDRRRTKVEARRWEWPAAQALLDAAAERGTPELRRLVNAAKIEFRVTLAVVTLLEGDRMWFAAASADTPVAIPLALSYDLHVPSDRPLVVPNAMDDQRFRDNPFIVQSHLPFYAGHPIHDLSGRMIGTFCVLAPQPRAGESITRSVLENYAREAEQELHRLEREALGSVTA
jgi:lysophospholipase L1-like esterase